MGRMNEDVFDCRVCGCSIVYEPANEQIVQCSNCQTKHKVIHTVEIQVLPEGPNRYLYETCFRDPFDDKMKIVLKDNQEQTLETKEVSEFAAILPQNIKLLVEKEQNGHLYVCTNISHYYGGYIHWEVTWTRKDDLKKEETKCLTEEIQLLSSKENTKEKK